MKKVTSLLLSLVPFVLLLMSVEKAWADIFPVPGYIVFPDKASDISLEKLNITIKANGDTTANYQFLNTSANRQTIKMLFPDSFYNWTSRENYYFKVNVNNKIIQTLKNKYASVSQFIQYEDKFGRPDETYTWEVSFEGKETKVITVQYPTQWCSWLECSDYCDSYWHVNKTGALWKGPIKQADIYLELPADKARELEQGTLSLSVEPENYSLKKNTMEWHFRDWNPINDLIIHEEEPLALSNNNRSQEWVVETAAIEIVKNLFREIRKKDPYMGNQRLYSANDLKHRSIPENYGRFYVKVLRNEIFARHGRQFNSNDLQEVFNYQKWYKPNLNYSDDLLNDIEKSNIKYIMAYEAKKGWR